MSKIKAQFVEAAMARLRSEMIEHKTIIDAYLDRPLDSIKNETYFNDIVEHAKALAVVENTYRVVQGTYTIPPAPTPEPNTESSITEEELLKRSSTFRKSTNAEPPIKKTRKTKEKK